MKKAAAYILTLILMISMVLSTAFAERPTVKQFQDRFLEYEKSIGPRHDGIWFWSWENENMVLLGEKWPSRIEFIRAGEESDRVGGIGFVCPKAGIAMGDDGSFPETLYDFSRLTTTMLDLFPELEDTSFRGDYSAYDIAYLTGNGESQVHSYPCGIVCMCNYNTKAGVDLFVFLATILPE